MIAWLRKLSQNRLLDVAAVALAALAIIRIAGMLPARAVENDFAHYYLSSRLLLDGANPYATPLEPVYARHGFVFHEGVPRATNPPPLVWLFAPLAALPAPVAFWLWVGAQIACLALVLGLTRYLLRDRLTPRGWRFVGLAAVTASAVYWHFYFSQAQLLLAALTLTGYAFHARGWPLSGCLAVVAAGLLKLFPFALLPWFVWRSGATARARLRAAALAAGASALGVWLTGPALWADFATHAKPGLAATAINHSFNFNVPSFVINLGYAANGFAPTPTAAAGWWWAGAVAALLVLVAGYAVCLAGRLSAAQQFSLLIVAMLAASLTARGHYLVFLIFPLTVLAAALRARPTVTGLATFAAIWVLVNVLGAWTGPWLDQRLVVKVLVNSLPLLGLALLGWRLAVTEGR